MWWVGAILFVGGVEIKVGGGRFRWVVLERRDAGEEGVAWRGWCLVVGGHFTPPPRRQSGPVLRASHTATPPPAPLRLTSASAEK